MPWLKFDEKQWEELKEALDRIVNVAKEIQVEMNPAPSFLFRTEFIEGVG